MSRPRKLRVLCLHGFNTTGDIMRFQMENIISTFESLIDFEFIDAPIIYDREPETEIDK